MTDFGDLRQAAQRGEAEAMLQLAQRLDMSGHHDEAVEWLGRAAEAGEVRAMAALGARLVLGTAAPKRVAEGLDLLRTAAGAGSGLAARQLALLTGAGEGAAQDWEEALAWLERAARCGEPRAAAELALLASVGDVDAWTAAAPVRWLRDGPRIGLVDGLLKGAPRDWLALFAAGPFLPAVVADAATGGFLRDPARTNSYAPASLLSLPFPFLFPRARIAGLVGQPTGHFEVLNVLRYEPGQQFDVHHDYIDPDEPGLQAELATLGQRVATVLVYLNDDYAGGETEFVDLGLRHRGRAGDALLFMNVDSDGAPDRLTRHAGRPPSAGRKWVLSQWVRDRAQPVN